MALQIIDCSCGSAVFGVDGCDIKLQDFTKIGIQKIFASDGTRNSIPKATAIDSAYVQSLINETDASKKLTIIDGADTITLLEKEPRATNTQANFDILTEKQGVYEVLVNFYNLNDNKLKNLRNICNGYALYLFGSDTNGNGIVRALDLGSNDDFIYPMPIQDNTVKVTRTTGKVSGESSVETLMFQLRKTVTSNNTNYAVMADGALDALVEAVAVKLEEVAITNTELTVMASFLEAPANACIPYDNVAISSWVLTDTTTDTVIVPTSIVVDGSEQLVYTVPATTAGNTYSLVLDANGLVSNTLTGTFVA